MREGHEHCDWEIKRLEAYRTEITQLKAEAGRLRKVDSRLAIKHQKLHEEQQSEINRLLLACETMQEQGRQYQESNAALQAKLDNAIDTAFDLEAENAKLRKALELAVDDAIHGANTGWEAKDYLGAACELESEGE